MEAKDNTRARFEGRVGELVSTDAPDMWKCFKEGVLKACDEERGKNIKGRRDQGDTWWRNEDVKEAIASKKDVHKEMCKSGTEVNKTRYTVEEHEESGKEGSSESNEGGS